MSRQVQTVLLCEDSQHEAFARRFLRQMGWSKRKIRVVKAPKGRGSGEQFVRSCFPRELRAQRQQPARRVLLVILDGDALGVDRRLKALDVACTEESVDARKPKERVAVFVPTWCIETWLAYLDGETVDESRKKYARLSRASECQKHVEVLVGMCRNHKLRHPAPSSLVAACEEYARLK